MDLSQLIPLVASLASAIAAILAWVAKIRWSDEYSRAKDETIKAKDTLIEVKDAQLQTLITNKDEIIKAKEEQIKVLEREVHSLNELTPMKIREYFLSVREQMEEYNALLKNQLDEAHKELEIKKVEIENLKQEGEKSSGEIEKLENERQDIAHAAKTLEDQLSDLRKKHERQDAILVTMPKVDMDAYKHIDISFKKLAEAMATSTAAIDYVKIARALQESFKIAQQNQEFVKHIVKAQNSINTYDKMWRLKESKSEKDEDNDSIDSDDQQNSENDKSAA